MKSNEKSLGCWFSSILIIYHGTICDKLEKLSISGEILSKDSPCKYFIEILKYAIPLTQNIKTYFLIFSKIIYCSSNMIILSKLM